MILWYLNKWWQRWCIDNQISIPDHPKDPACARQEEANADEPEEESESEEHLAIVFLFNDFFDNWVSSASTCFELSSDQNPGHVLYVGDNITQLYRDQNKPL